LHDTNNVITSSPFQTREAPPFPVIPYRPVSIKYSQENRLGDGTIKFYCSVLYHIRPIINKLARGVIS